MQNIRSELRAVIAAAIHRAQETDALPPGDVSDIVVEYPPRVAKSGTEDATEAETLGDYASPVALALGKQWKQSPMSIAETIGRCIESPSFVRAVEAVAPGYLNVHLDPRWLTAKVDDLIEEGPTLGRSDVGRGTSVNLEFVSANPTGEPHVGNGRALFTADVLGNALALAGYAVTREYYINDVGAQVEKYGESVLRRILQSIGEEIEYPEGLYPGDDVVRIAAHVRQELTEDRGHTFSAADLENAELRAEITRRAVDATIRELQGILEHGAKVRYDVWFRESTLHAQGDVAHIVAELTKRGHTVERDGALWLTTTAFGDEKDRVLVRGSGEMTYLAGDIAYHLDKFRRGHQLVVDFWGADHQGHILPLRAALQALGEDPNRLRVVLVHLVRVVQGGEAKKISKREGTAVPLRELLDLVGLSAARFFLTAKSLTSPLDFDLDLARTRQEENPVYYVQYAYVRLTSILRKAKQQNLLDGWLMPPARAGSAGAEPGGPVVDAPRAAQWFRTGGPRALLTQEAEVRLLGLMIRFPEVVEDVVRSWEVHRLTHYAFELARAVHRFYDAVPVLASTERDVLRSRLSLVVAAQTVLGAVFDLLGIERREVM